MRPSTIPILVWGIVLLALIATPILALLRTLL